MDKKQLRREFDLLSLEGVQCDKSYADAQHQVYGLLARAYIYFRKVQGVPNFLLDLYDAHGITYDASENMINFRPFVRVTFRLSLPNLTDAERNQQHLTPGSQNNRLSDYANALAAVDAEWNANPDGYKHEAEAKLTSFISDRGLRQIIKDGKDEKDKASGKNPPPDEADINATRKALAETALLKITSDKTKIGSATITKPEQVHFGADGLTACICRLNKATGAFEIIATSSDDNVIRGIAEGDTARLNWISSPALQTLAEVVATQSFPSRFIPGGNRAKLTGALKAWYNAVYLEEGKAKGTANNRRLVLRGRDILLSSRRSDASVVTILRPIHRLVPKVTDEYYLRPENLRTLEEWIENKTIAARTSTPKAALGKADAKVSAPYMLTVKNTATDTKENRLFFYDVHRVEDNPNSMGQVDFAPKQYKAAWSFSANREWLMHLRNQFLDNWFRLAAAGKKLKRWENNFFEITVTATRIVFGYEIDDTNTNPSETIKLAKPAKVTEGASYKFRVSTKDLAPILYNISDFGIGGDIKFAGDASVMTIQFKTEMGQYTVAIPTVTGDAKKLERDATHFKAYAARGDEIGKD